MVSDGAEVILISRKSFLETISANSTLKMRFQVPPYPNDENFILKYFSFRKWERFRHELQQETLEKINEKTKVY